MKNLSFRQCAYYRFLLMLLVISSSLLFIPTSSGSESDQIEYMDYLLEFKFKNSDENFDLKTRLQLEINHTGFVFPGNGTIKYTIEDAMTDSRVLYLISQVYPIEFVNYFSDPTSSDYLLTHYYNRTESPDPLFNTSKSFTIFWMHEEMDYIENFISFGRVYFFNTSSPFSLAIDDVVPISHGSKRWSETFGGRLFDTHISTCFILSIDAQIGDDRTYIHLYYDRATGMLLYGKFYVKQVTDDGKIISVMEIHHISSTFPITSSFNWWLILTIIVFSGAGAIVSWVIYNLVRNGPRKKPSRLDEI